jgi:hypothetical protein
MVSFYCFKEDNITKKYLIEIKHKKMFFYYHIIVTFDKYTPF